MKIWLRIYNVENKDYNGMGRIYMALSRTFKKMGLDFTLENPNERCIEICIGGAWQPSKVDGIDYNNYLIGFTTGESLIHNIPYSDMFDCFFVMSEYYKLVQTIDKPIYIWHLGIETELFNMIDRQTNPFVLSHIGVTQYRKGSHLACAAFNDVFGNNPDFELHIICQSENVEMFRVLQQTYQKVGNIKFISMLVPLEKLSSLYYGNCLLFPSLREGWGLHLTEAMASGMPTIISDLPVLREQFNESFGWSVKVERIGNDGCAILDYNDLCVKIRTVGNNRELCIAKGRYAYDYAHQFLTWEYGVRTGLLPVIQHLL